MSMNGLGETKSVAITVTIATFETLITITPAQKLFVIGTAYSVNLMYYVMPHL